MKLTPIRVKGKGGPKQKPRPPGPQRGMKRSRDEDDGGSGGGINDGSSRRPFQSRKPAAAIEELPTEVLERIIFLSGNLNVLRSSLRLGYRFSSPSFLTELLGAAFAPTWDALLGHTANLINSHHSSYSKSREYTKEMPGDPDFQGAVLACPWANIQVILEAQQIWCRRNGGPGRFAELVMHPAERDRFPAPPPLLPSDLPARFEMDWETFKRECLDFLSSSNPSPTVSSLQVGLYKTVKYMELQPSTAVPKRLLTGPFDWEAARTMFWLYRSGISMRWRSSWMWEAAFRGYSNILALEDRDLAWVLCVLLDLLGAFTSWPLFLLGQELDKLAQRIERPGDLADQHLCWVIYLLLDGHTDSKRRDERGNQQNCALARKRALEESG